MKANKKFHSKRSTKKRNATILQKYCNSHISPLLLPTLYSAKNNNFNSVNSDFKLVVLIYNKSVQYVKKKNQNVKYKECR